MRHAIANQRIVPPCRKTKQREAWVYKSMGMQAFEKGKGLLQRCAVDDKLPAGWVNQPPAKGTMEIDNGVALPWMGNKRQPGIDHTATHRLLCHTQQISEGEFTAGNLRRQLVDLRLAPAQLS